MTHTPFHINFLFFILFFGYSSLAQQLKIVDFIEVEALIKANRSTKRVQATVTYTFKILKKTDSIFLDAKGIKVLDILSKGTMKIAVQEDKIWLLSSFIANKLYTISFSYEVYPKKAFYFTENQIWTQGQGKYTSNWLPSIDDMNDKMVFNLSVITPLNETVVANGKLVKVSKRDSLQQWDFKMSKPMASYLVALAIGDFKKMEITSTSGVPIELYIETRDFDRIEPTYRYTKEIFDFLEKKINVPYPWQMYKQVPVHDFLYAGMENTSATFFSEAFVIDSIGFNDRNYLNVNAHELAHQWFGNLVTETEGTHHWLHEGFATYFAHLAEKEIFGEDYFYWKMFQSAEQLSALSDEGKGEVLVNSKASSLTFYEKGAWALHILKEKVGEDVFFKAIKNYLIKYQYQNVTTDDFILEVEKIYGHHLTNFKNDWLYQSAFKTEQAYQSLIRSSFMEDFFQISSLRSTPLSLKVNVLEKALQFPNDFTGQEVIYQLEGEPIALSEALYRSAFYSKNIYVRQAIALTVPRVPVELKNEYETLLDDESYVTQEAAMGNLWVSFPENKENYLNRMDGVIGFKDKNIRQYWLFLALLTENYRTPDRPEFKKELNAYASSNYDHNVREIALKYLSYLGSWEEDSLRSLIDAGQHHYWRFKKFSREILKGLLEDDNYREKLILLKKDLTPPSAIFLDRMLLESKT